MTGSIKISPKKNKYKRLFYHSFVKVQKWFGFRKDQVFRRTRFEELTFRQLFKIEKIIITTFRVHLRLKYSKSYNN
jgi:hypothetical protein